MVDFTSTTFTGTEGQDVRVCVELLSGSVARPLPVMVGLSATDGTTRGTITYQNIVMYSVQVHIYMLHNKPLHMLIHYNSNWGTHISSYS